MAGIIQPIPCFQRVPLYVIYIPYATVESTGLATSPVSEGAPWLMDAGKPWAHIMVGTGRQLGDNSGNTN